MSEHSYLKSFDLKILKILTWFCIFDAYITDNSTMKIHFIAIGGSAMHNLAIALQQKGYQITGSDDTIHDPSKTRLANKGLLPR